MTSIFNGQYTTDLIRATDEINAERYVELGMPCLCDVALLPDGLSPHLALTWNLPVTIQLVPPDVRQAIFRAVPYFEKYRGTPAAISKAAEVLGIRLDTSISIGDQGQQVLTVLSSIPAYELNEEGWNNFIRPFLEQLIPWTVELGRVVNGHVIEQQLYIGGGIHVRDRVISRGVARNG